MNILTIMTVVKFTRAQLEKVAMFRYMSLFIPITLLAVYLMGCGSDSKPSEAKVDLPKTSQKEKEVVAVCILDGISLREEPLKSSKYLSSIKLGEKVTWLSASEFDSVNNIEYYKVKLLDETVGWASATYIIENARPAAITKKSPTYERPDLLTISDKAFEPLDIVAVFNTKGDWYEVMGKRREGKFIEKAWLRNNSFSFKEEDVAIASLTTKALASSRNQQMEKLKEILNNPVFSSSSLLHYLRQVIDELKTEENRS